MNSILDTELKMLIGVCVGLNGSGSNHRGYQSQFVLDGSSIRENLLPGSIGDGQTPRNNELRMDVFDADIVTSSEHPRVSGR